MSDKAKAYYVAKRYDEAVSFWKASLVMLGEATTTDAVSVVLERGAFVCL